MNLTVGSLFSGIGGFDLGFERAGMRPLWMCEIDKACQGVLRRHWPGVDIYDSVTRLSADNLIRPDVLCGGFPCQDVSVAGRRAGLAGERSGLWYEFYRIIESLRPQWIVIENVPGLLSSNGGRDFAVILRGLVECGYGVAWRVLDAQYFGVAQRRRRVFIVASDTHGGGPVKVLFERKSLSGDTSPRRTPEAQVARSLANGSVSSGYRFDPNGEEYIVEEALTGWDEQRQRIYSVGGITPTLASEEGRGHGSPSVFVAPFDPVNVTSNANRSRVEFGLPSPTLHQQAEAVTTASHPVSPPLTSEGHDGSEDGRGRHAFVIAPHYGVRRLMPVECERLQGFPDDWTAGQSDSARYRQLGNAVCVNVAEWLGHRIVEAALEHRVAAHDGYP